MNQREVRHILKYIGTELLPWVRVPEYGRDLVDPHPMNPLYYAGEYITNLIILPTGFSKYSQTEYRLGVFTRDRGEDELRQLTIDTQDLWLWELFSQAELDLDLKPHFTVAYLNKPNLMQRSPEDVDLYSSTDLFLGNFLYSLPEEEGLLPGKVYLTLISSAFEISKDSVTRNIAALGSRFSKIVLYEKDNPSTEWMGLNPSGGNGSILCVFLIPKVAHQTWLRLLEVSNESELEIIGATGDQSFAEALSLSDKFISYELRDHKMDFYAGFKEALLLEINDLLEKSSSTSGFRRGKTLRAAKYLTECFFAKLSDGYLPQETEETHEHLSDQIYNNPDFRDIYTAAKMNLLAKYNLATNLIKALKMHMPGFKLADSRQMLFPRYRGIFSSTAQDEASETPLCLAKPKPPG